MTKQLTSLRRLGHATVLRILRAARPDEPAEPICAGLQSASPLLLFAEHAPEERLALTASLRAGGGREIYFGPGEWFSEPNAFKENAFLYGLSSRLCAVRGLGRRDLEIFSAACGSMTLNCGGPDAHPCRALGDIALMLESRPDPEKLRIAWIGGANGLAHSLIEAAMLLPFELFMALPEWGEPAREDLALAFAAGAKIFLTREPHMAADGAHFVYAGAGPEAFAAGGALQAGMAVDETVLSAAVPQAGLLRGAARGSRVPDDLLGRHRPLEAQRAAARRSVQALIWDWFFEDENERGALQ